MPKIYDNKIVKYKSDKMNESLHYVVQKFWKIDMTKITFKLTDCTRLNYRVWKTIPARNRSIKERIFIIGGMA